MTDINKIKSLIKAIDNDFINSRRKSNLTTLIPIKYLNDMYYEYREYMRLRPISWKHIKNYKDFLPHIQVMYLIRFLNEYIGVLDQQDLYYIMNKLEYYGLIEDLDLDIIQHKSQYDIPKSDLYDIKLFMTKLKYNLYQGIKL